MMTVALQQLAWQCRRPLDGSYLESKGADAHTGCIRRMTRWALLPAHFAGPALQGCSQEGIGGAQVHDGVPQAVCHSVGSMQQPHQASSRLCMALVGFAGLKGQRLLSRVCKLRGAAEDCRCSTHFDGVAKRGAGAVHGQALDGCWLQRGFLHSRSSRSMVGSLICMKTLQLLQSSCASETVEASSCHG